jgi:hypothetical protein
MRVLILGTAPDSLAQMPKESDWIIWSLLGNHDRIERADQWFEMHHPQYLRDIGCAKQADLLASVENCVTLANYPLEDVAALADYFTCSIAYMIALAIVRGATHIGLYGVNLNHESEYAYERPCVEFWLGMAAGQGVKVEVAEASPVLKSSRRYGAEDWKLLAKAQQMAAEAEAAKRQAQNDFESAIGKQNYFNGYLDAIKEIRRA